MLDQGIPSPEPLDRNNDTQPESPSMTSGSSLLFVAQLATNLGYFVAVLLFARALEPSQRGTLAFLTITALVVSRVARLGLADATTVYVAKNPAQRPALLSNLIAFTSALMVAGAGLVSLLIVATGAHPAGLEYHQLIPLSIGILASGLLDAGYEYILGLGRIRELAFLNATGPWLYAALVAATYAWFGLTATRAIIVWAIAHSVWSAMLLVASVRYVRPGRLDRPLLRETFHFGLRAWIGGLSRFLNFRLDQILMGFITTEAALGIYAVAVNASEVLLVLPGAAAAAAIPILARTSWNEQLERTLRILRSVILLTTATVVIAMLAGPPLISLVFGSRYDGSRTPFLLLAPGAIFFAAMALISSALVAASSPGRSSVGPVAALVSGFILDLILIPPYGATGAAIAATAGFAFGAVAGLLALRSFRKFPWSTLAPAREDVRALLSLVARRGSLQPHDEVEPS